MRASSSCAAEADRCLEASSTSTVERGGGAIGPGAPGPSSGPAVTARRGIPTLKPITRRGPPARASPTGHRRGRSRCRTGPIRLVRLRLTLALIAMAFLPIAVAAPILSTALDSQRAIEQTQVERDAASVASDLTARLEAVSTALVKTSAGGALAAYAGGSKNGLPAARAALVALSGEAADQTVVATLLDVRGRQLLRAVGGQVVKPGPTTVVDPLVGAALDAGRGRVESDLVRTGDEEAARLALATPVLGGTGSATAVGIVRVEISLDRLILASRRAGRWRNRPAGRSTGSDRWPRPHGPGTHTGPHDRRGQRSVARRLEGPPGRADPLRAATAAAHRPAGAVRRRARGPRRLDGSPDPATGRGARGLARSPARHVRAGPGRLAARRPDRSGQPPRLPGGLPAPGRRGQEPGRLARAGPDRSRRLPGGQRGGRARRRRPGPGRVRSGRRGQHAHRRPRLPDRRRRIRPAAAGRHGRRRGGRRLAGSWPPGSTTARSAARR